MRRLGFRVVQKRDRIIALLTFYNDVRQGFSDPPNGGGDGVSRYGGAWNEPSYTQLRALLLEMRLLSVVTYRHLTGYYMGSKQVRRARCPRCSGLFAPSTESRTQFCDGVVHGRRLGRAVTLEPYMERVPPPFVVPRFTSLGVDWLEQRWVGHCDLPRELLDVLSTRAVEGLKRGKPLVLAT